MWEVRPETLIGKPLVYMIEKEKIENQYVAVGKGTELPLTGPALTPLHILFKQMAQYIQAEIKENVDLSTSSFNYKLHMCGGLGWGYSLCLTC